MHPPFRYPGPGHRDADQFARLLQVSVQLNTTGSSEALLPHIIETAAEVLDCQTKSTAHTCWWQW